MAKKNTVKLEGNDYTIKFTLNSMRKLEKEFGISLSELGENFDMEKVQTLLYVGMNKHHPDLTFEDIGDLVDMAEIHGVVEGLTQALGGLQQSKS